MIIYAQSVGELKDIEDFLFSKEWDEKPDGGIISIICSETEQQYYYEPIYEFGKWRISTYN